MATGEARSDNFRFEKNGNKWVRYHNDDNFDIVNTPKDDGAGELTRDKTKYYYTICDPECDVFVSKKVAGKFTKPLKLNKNINIPNYWNAQPTLSPTADTMFFASKRPNGKLPNSKKEYDHDIWMSINKDKTGATEEWGTAINLTNINTPYIEIAPFWDDHTNTIYFASNGHVGFGGWDIYQAKGKNRDSIVNLGMPFNSARDDFYFILGKEKGYLVSNREGGIGKDDIYSFDINVKESTIGDVPRDSFADAQSISSVGRIILNDTQKPVADLPVFLKDDKGNIISEGRTNANGEFRFENLPPDKNFKITINENDPRLKTNINYEVAKKEPLIPNIDATGVLVDKITKKPIPNAPIEIKDATGKVVQTTITDASGKYVVKDLAGGVAYKASVPVISPVSKKAVVSSKFVSQSVSTKTTNNLIADNTISTTNAVSAPNANSVNGIEKSDGTNILNATSANAGSIAGTPNSTGLKVEAVGNANVSGTNLASTPSANSGSVTATPNSTGSKVEVAENANVSGTNLTSTPSANSGSVAATPNSTGSKVEGSGNANVSGTNLTSTPSANSGSVAATPNSTGSKVEVAGNANVSGTNLTNTPSANSGSVAATPNSTGSKVEVAGNSNVSSTNLTSTPSANSGSVAATPNSTSSKVEVAGNANVSGTNLTSTPSANSGSVTATPTSTAGSKVEVAGNANVSGTNLTSTSSANSGSGTATPTNTTGSKVEVAGIPNATSSNLTSSPILNSVTKVEKPNSNGTSEVNSISSNSSVNEGNGSGSGSNPTLTKNTLSTNSSIFNTETSNQSLNKSETSSSPEAVNNDQNLPASVSSTAASATKRNGYAQKYKETANEPDYSNSVASGTKSRITIDNFKISSSATKPSKIFFENVYFDFNNSELTAISKKAMDQMVTYYGDHREIQIEIKAYSDGFGNPDYNKQLAEERGKACYDYFQVRGVDQTALLITPAGENNPVASNSSFAGRQLNRRVEFSIVGSKAPFQPEAMAHVLEPRMTLFSVAKKYGMSLAELKDWNGGINAEDIKAYSVLRVKRPLSASNIAPASVNYVNSGTEEMRFENGQFVPVSK